MHGMIELCTVVYELCNVVMIYSTPFLSLECIFSRSVVTFGKTGSTQDRVDPQ